MRLEPFGGTIGTGICYMGQLINTVFTYVRPACWRQAGQMVGKRKSSKGLNIIQGLLAESWYCSLPRGYSWQ